jgi:hypothetical protein
MRGLEASLGTQLASATVAAASVATATATATGASLGGWLSPLAAKVALSVAMGACVGAAICATSEYINASSPAHVVVRADSRGAEAAKPSRESPPSFAESRSEPAAPAPLSPAITPKATRSRPEPARGALRRAAPRAEAPRANIDGNPEFSAPPSEIDLIDRAERAVATRPDEAKLWLQEHERRFSDGAFVEEREVIFIEAAVRAGDGTEARWRAARFYARFAATPYRARIEGFLRGAGGS